MPERLRLDQLLVARGLAATRSRARDAILRGAVSVGGVLADRPGVTVGTDAEIAIDDDARRYVSRGALKLAAALDRFGFSPLGRIALDIGASTGGFTEVLLERGAERVFAVDVGHDQLHPRLRADRRVEPLEGTNARDLTRDQVPVSPAALVADVSFISLRLALPAALDLAAPGAWLVALVKPQFEAGRDAVGKGGIVRDAALAQSCVADIAKWLGEQPGWRVEGILPSPIAGGDGNREYLVGAQRG